MTIEEIAARLQVLVNEGKNLQAEEELYAANVVSHEMDGRTARGLEAVIAKTKEAFTMFEEVHKSELSKYIINQDTILAIFEMDFKPKGGERMAVTEYGIYKVEDGKIVEEYFYM